MHDRAEWNKLQAMSMLTIGSWGGWLAVVLTALLFRGRPYALFLGVILGIYTLVAVAVLPLLPLPIQLVSYLHACAYLQWLLLAWPRMRPIWYRLLLSLPGLYFSASVLLAFPWAICAALGFRPWGIEVPFALGAIGLFQSLTTRPEVRQLSVGDQASVEGIVRVPLGASQTVNVEHPGAPRPLRLVQLTDTHLGPFMSVARLERICQRAVDAAPDLIVLTGDFLTMESQTDARWLVQALAPLRAYPGRVFACLGNHDHEAPAIVRQALDSAGARLLVDDSTLIETPAGKVQLVGFDFAFRQRAEHMLRVCAAHPRVPGALRLALLHDPGAFRHLPAGEADLVLSGHTHGGQLGLVSFRLPWTVVSWIAKIPDHGLWGRGSDRLYVHRGTGHYGFPLRLGVPAEESVLLVDYSGWALPASHTAT